MRSGLCAGGVGRAQRLVKFYNTCAAVSAGRARSGKHGACAQRCVCVCVCVCVSVCVCVCVWAVSKDVKLVSYHILLQGATGEVYSQWPTKTLYTSCVNVPALVLTVDLRFC